MEIFYVYSHRVAAALTRRGFKIIKTVPSKKIAGRVVYVFEDSLDFQIALQEITEKK